MDTRHSARRLLSKNSLPNSLPVGNSRNEAPGFACSFSHACLIIRPKPTQSCSLSTMSERAYKPIAATGGERRLFKDALTSCGAYQSRYAISSNASQRSARAVGLIMDARSSEPGLDIPQTRQRLEPALTSAPQPLQAKANIASESLIRTARTFSSLRLFRVESQEEGADFREAFAIYRSAPVFEGACSGGSRSFGDRPPLPVAWIPRSGIMAPSKGRARAASPYQPRCETPRLSQLASNHQN